MQSCPICGQDFAVDYLPTHAAWCDERPMPSCSTQPQLQDRAEGVQDRPEGVDDGAWRNIADVGMAAVHFRQALLVSKEDERNLKVKLDMAEDEVDREGQIINFYKTPNIDWARPFHAKLQVFGRIKEQLKQIKQGLKETYVLDLLEARPDAITQVFPSEAEATCSPEVVLDFIQWPQVLLDFFFGFLAIIFLMQFISTVSQDKLKQLVKFWVGWEIPMTEMKVEVVDSNHYPRASTCFRTLRLPSHYQTYDDFRQSLVMCLGTSEFGFGLI